MGKHTAKMRSWFARHGGWALVLSASESHAVTLEYGSNTPASLTIEELRHRFAGEAFCLSPIAPEASDPSVLPPRTPRKIIAT